MSDKVYAITRKIPNSIIRPNQNKEFEIYGIYDSKEKALEACSAFKKYFNLVGNLYDLEIVDFDINKSYKSSDIILIFDLHFNYNMEIIPLNWPEMSYSNKVEPGFGWLGMPHSDVKDDEIEFQYHCNNNTITAKCKIIVDIMTVKNDLNKLIGESKHNIIKDYYKRFSCLKEMVDKVTINIKPNYNFAKDSIELLEVKLDDYFKYSEESIDLFKSILYDYVIEIEKKVLPDYNFYNFNRSKELLKEILIDNDIDKRIKDKCQKTLSEFYWYKDEGSLNKGLKEFFIHGSKIFNKNEKG